MTSKHQSCYKIIALSSNPKLCEHSNKLGKWQRVVQKKLQAFHTDTDKTNKNIYILTFNSSSTTSSSSRSTARSHRATWLSSPADANTLGSDQCHSTDVIGAV